MPEASRLQDQSQCPNDSHGSECCPHAVQGPAINASENVLINGRGALRINDAGVHTACCGPNTWVAAAGSHTVLINGRGSVRKNDRTQHCGGVGQMIEGSSNVLIGG